MELQPSCGSLWTQIANLNANRFPLGILGQLLGADDQTHILKSGPPNQHWVGLDSRKERTTAVFFQDGDLAGAELFTLALTPKD